MAITTDQLRTYSQTQFPDNDNQEINPKDLRDFGVMVADIMDAADIDATIDALQFYVDAAQVISDHVDSVAIAVDADRVAVLAAVADMDGGTTGQTLVKASNADFDYTWATLENAGDMLKLTYDPTNKAADAFSMGNMVETSTKKILTDAERAKLAGVSTGATANQTDSFLRNRSNHTGSQPLATISDVTASAAELNLLDGAVDHDLTAWRAATSTDKALISPAMLGAVSGAKRYAFFITTSGTVDLTAIKAELDPDTMVQMFIWGGGAGGARNNYAAGGGGGGCTPVLIRLGDLPDILTATIGQGGAGRSTDGNGNNGQNTTLVGTGFSKTGYAGKGGGNSSSDNTNLTGGNPGGVFAEAGIANNGSDSIYGGGQGAGRKGSVSGGSGGSSLPAVNYVAGNGIYGAGGGSQNILSGPGKSLFGGFGGDIGQNGQAPGGGGGASTGGTSGTGARGEIRIFI